VTILVSDERGAATVERAPETERTATLRRTPNVERVTDEVWGAVRPILERYDPPRRLGRKRIDQRAALDAIVYRLQSGCRWNHLPKEFPDDSSVHRTYQRWERIGVLHRVLDTLAELTRERGTLRERVEARAQ
jgi:transposase